ncbi:MAG TPA: PEP-CTERM sorting domain-containing protein [Blastocatellia bacterium]|nr:PEP-CTERM sorting domain-containing protein [Blastocatellia bacterium]
MKKRMLAGAVLYGSLLLSVVVYANPIRDTTDPITTQKAEQLTTSANPEKATPSAANGPVQDRSNALSEQGARWSWMDQSSDTMLLAFTSTFAAQQAAKQAENNGNSLSFASFGRVPFYQTLSYSNGITTSSFTKSRSSSVTSLPEPASLTLLGAGLAALAGGLRKKIKKNGK